MDQEKSDQRLEESEKDTKRAPLPTADAAMKPVGSGDDQSAVPTLTKGLVRMLESSQDGKLDLKAASQELKAPRSTIDYVSTILEGIQFLKRISSDVVQMTGAPDHRKLTERLEESWKAESTLDGWVSQLQSLRFNSPDGEKGDKPAETKETPNRGKSESSTKEEPEMIGKRTLLSPYPSKSPSNTTPSSTSYPRPASRRRTTPVYIFGQSTPFKKQFTPADRLVQVSSEDTDESNPSNKSDASTTNFSSPESLPHPLSPAATIRNARSRVLLLANSPDHDSAASSSGSATTTKKSSSSSKTAPSAAAAPATKTPPNTPKGTTLKDYDFSKKRVPSFVSKRSSGDEVSKRPKKQSR
mmetsp:Transcript_18033/g.44551  ORF Transcript_18033/g.44551 Transcript_18033/m.44551 type:complete len:356 (+) Transcript_18033:146-1213(+)